MSFKSCSILIYFILRQHNYRNGVVNIDTPLSITRELFILVDNYLKGMILLKYEEGLKLYNEIKSCGLATDEDWQELFNDMLTSAVEYAQIRADWFFMNHVKRAENDSSRTINHNAFISSLKTLARNGKKQGYNCEWEQVLEKDRKEIGDLACYIHCFLSIESR